MRTSGRGNRGVNGIGDCELEFTDSVENHFLIVLDVVIKDGG